MAEDDDQTEEQAEGVTMPPEVEAVSRDTSDPAYVARRKREVKRIDDHARKDLLWVMSDYRGRAFLWKKLGDCDIFTAGFPDNDRLLNFDQGRRTIGLNLQQDCVEADSKLYNLMRDEAIERDKQRED